MDFPVKVHTESAPAEQLQVSLKDAGLLFNETTLAQCKWTQTTCPALSIILSSQELLPKSSNY